VLATRHARLYTAILLAHDGSRSVFVILGVYGIQYGVQVPPPMVAPIIACYVLGGLAGVPLWVCLAKTLGKLRAFMASIVAFALAHLLLVPVAHPQFTTYLSESSRVLYAVVIASVLGFMASAKNPIGDSIGGDVIDVDQANSSEPAGAGRHGTFWAFWFFCTKSIGGVMTLSSGLLLQASGFVPNQPVQAQSTRLVLVGFMVAIPFAGLTCAALLMRHFDLDEAAHGRALATMRQRRDEAESERKTERLL